MGHEAVMARPELVLIADTVAHDRNIDREHVFTAMEQAIQKAGRLKYGQERDIRARIDRRDGGIHLDLYTEVVAEVENDYTQISVEQARRRKTDAGVGEFIVDTLPPIDFGRIAAQTAKQVIAQKVRDAERERQYQDYKERVGQIINGQVKRVEFGNVIVDLDRSEAMLRRDELIPREHFKNGDHVRAYIKEVRRESWGPQIFLSRADPIIMVQLFRQEVPEIYDGIIAVKACAREPGSRAKIAVRSSDASIDPVGACVGMRGSRVQAVVDELRGEKVDIIPWSADPATFVVNALAPAEVAKVVLDEDRNRIEVVVAEDQLSFAIGRRGQNVRLASRLTGWDISIMSEEVASAHRQEEHARLARVFTEALDVDEVLARLLVMEGFGDLEEVAYVSTDEIAAIEGMDATLAEELQRRARQYLEAQAQDALQKCSELNVSGDLLNAEGLTPAKVAALAEHGVLTLDDLAGLASDELLEYLGEDVISEAEASAVVMAARRRVGWLDDDNDGDEGMDA